jgi:hypothetical protein
VPRFFFDLHDGRWHPDEDGTDCADLEDARSQARRLLAVTASEHAARDRPRDDYAVLIRDGGRRPVYSAALSFRDLSLPEDA